jgi:hypothetical protein
MVGVIITGRATVQKTLKTQPNIADIDTSTVDGTYGSDEATVLTDLQTKVQTLIDQLEANGTLASS